MDPELESALILTSKLEQAKAQVSSSKKDGSTQKENESKTDKPLKSDTAALDEFNIFNCYL